MYYMKKKNVILYTMLIQKERNCLLFCYIIIHIRFRYYTRVQEIIDFRFIIITFFLQ